MRFLVGVAALVVVLDAVLLALTEVAWLSLRVGTVPLPLSALVALVTTPLLVRAADAVLPGTRLALVPVAVWLVVVLVTGLWSPAGPGMFPPDWRGILLVAAGLLPGAWVAARPVRPTSTAAAAEPASPPAP